jgi:hypothetical protein
MKKTEIVKQSAEQSSVSLIEMIERAEWQEMMDQIAALAGNLTLLEEQLARTGGETNARLAEIEKEIFNQRPEVEKFISNIGPMVSAAQRLREEVENYKSEIGVNLSLHSAQLKEILETQTSGLEELLRQPAAVREELRDVALNCGIERFLSQAAAQRCEEALKQMADTREEACLAIGKVAEKTGAWAQRETAKLEEQFQRFHGLYRDLKERLWAKTATVAAASALAGALVGSLVITLYTMSRIDAVAETQRAASKWEFLIKKRETERQGAGEELNRQTEQEIENKGSH